MITMGKVKIMANDDEIDRAAKDNPDLPCEFVGDALIAMEEIGVGNIHLHERRKGDRRMIKKEGLLQIVEDLCVINPWVDSGRMAFYLPHGDSGCVEIGPYTSQIADQAGVSVEDAMEALSELKAAGKVVCHITTMDCARWWVVGLAGRMQDA